MTDFALRLTAPDQVSRKQALQTFVWSSSGPSTFMSPGLGPGLGALGEVPPLNVDLARIALAVYAADRSVSREAGGSNWNQREFKLKIPVSDPGKWTEVAADLQAVVAFLTGDAWEFKFVRAARLKESRPEAGEGQIRRVVLLSGGADSAIGALISRSELDEDEGHILLSHYSASFLAPLQREVADAIVQLLPGSPQEHRQIHLLRKAKRLDGTAFPSESSTRSRSLLFLALGLAVAGVEGVPLWIPENGFAAINPPLGPERRGSLSTHTTHPAFLAGLSAVLSEVGAHNEIENPFSRETKGELFQRASNLVGKATASAFLSATNSCAHTGQRSFGVSPTLACGVCFGCVLRRASFAASGVPDTTAYIQAGGDAGLQRWLDSRSVAPAVRSFIRRGVTQRDLIALSLPSTLPLADAQSLCDRAVAELNALDS